MKLAHDGKVRLHKYLASSGIGSRRRCEALIAEGKVMVDGHVVVEMGHKIIPGAQKVMCEGAYIKTVRLVHYLLNKPKGYLCANRDASGRKLVIDLFRSVKERVFTVGRLDVNTEGALIVTNDGELCNRLTHPRYQIDKTYHVVVDGDVTVSLREQFKKGVYLSEGRTGSIKVRVKKRMRDKSILEVTIHDGMNREIHRIFAKYGLDVQSIKRIQVGPISLGSLSKGCFRRLTDEEINTLRDVSRGLSQKGRKKK